MGFAFAQPHPTHYALRYGRVGYFPSFAAAYKVRKVITHCSARAAGVNSSDGSFGLTQQCSLSRDSSGTNRISIESQTAPTKGTSAGAPLAMRAEH